MDIRCICFRYVGLTSTPEWCLTEDVDILNHYLTSLEEHNVDWSEKINKNTLQYVDIFHTIDLPIFKYQTADLIRIYRKEYPYATEQDFRDKIFGGTIYHLQNFLTNKDRYIWRGDVLINGAPTSDRSVYAYIDSGEWIVFIAEVDKDIDHYIQYFSYVLSFIENISFEDLLLTSKPAAFLILDLEITKMLKEELKTYFPNHQKEWCDFVDGYEVDGFLVFLGNLNQIGEVFKRLHHYGHINSTKKTISDWMHEHIKVIRKVGDEPKKLTTSTLENLFNRNLGLPQKGKRLITNNSLFPIVSDSDYKEKKI